MPLSPLMLDLLTFGGAAAFLALVFVMIQASQKNSRRNARIAKLKAGGKPTSVVQNKSNLRRQSTDSSLSCVTQMTQSLSLMEKLRNRLEMADIKSSAEKYLLICFAIIIVGFFLGVFAMHKAPLVSLLGSFSIGVGLPHFVVSQRIASRNKKFLGLFPDAIDLVVRGLRAGLPVTKSMQTVSEELGDPVAKIFRQMVGEIGLGVPLEKCLFSMAERLGITEFNFFVTSIILQRETGGNLAEILGNLSEVLRQRQMFKLKIKAMATEARASASIVGSLPVFVFLALTFVSPKYLEPFYTDSRGTMMAFAALGSLGFGIFVMARMSKFEI